MAKERTWPLVDARAVAEELVALLQRDCERIQIAGSIRRQRPQVGDIELLAVSKMTNAFFQSPPGNPMGYLHLDSHLDELIGQGILAYRLNKRGARTYGQWNKFLIHIPSGIPLDIFSTTLPNWGMSMVVRTGPKDFNVKVMNRFRSLNFRGHAYGGVTDPLGNEVQCPTEERVFELLGGIFIPPKARY